jgi:hypothetical protein
MIRINSKVKSHHCYIRVAAAILWFIFSFTSCLEIRIVQWYILRNSCSTSAPLLKRVQISSQFSPLKHILWLIVVNTHYFQNTDLWEMNSLLLVKLDVIELWTACEAVVVLWKRDILTEKEKIGERNASKTHVSDHKKGTKK